MARTSNFSNIATVTRASKKTDAGGWDFQDGSVVGALAEYDNNVAAIHPTAGLRHEQATTNEIRNPRAEGAVTGVVGSGGAVPTHWNVFGVGASVEVVSTGTESGWPYVDIRIFGTPTTSPVIQFEQSTLVVASVGQTWASSFGCKLVGGGLTNVVSLQKGILGTSSAGGFVEGVGLPFTCDSLHRRFAHSYALSNASSERVISQITLAWTSGAIDVTLRVYAPQLEQKDNPTGPVFPSIGSPAAASRAADVVSIPNGAWVSSGDFSLFVDYCPDYVTGGTKYILLLGSVSDGLRTFYRTAGNTFIVASGGVTQVNLDGDVPSSGVSRKIAAGVAADNFALSVNGATQLTDSSGLVPSVAGDLLLGSFDTAGGFAIDGYIKDFRYWPRRLSNAELEALVGN